MNDSNGSEQRNMSRTILRNSTFGISAQLALRVVSFLFQILVVRQLGDDQFGQYSLVLAWTMLFGVIGDLGITQYLAREIARDHNNTTKLFWDVVTLRFLLAFVAAAITTIGAIANGYSGDLLIGIVIYTSSYFIQAAIVPIASVLTGNERVDITAALAVITQVLFMVVSLIFLSQRLNFKWLVVASVVNLPIILLLHIAFIRRQNLSPPRFHINPHLWYAILRDGFPFAFMQIALSFSYRIDTVLLGQVVTNAEIGWYNVAYGLTLTLLTFTRAFNDAFLPSLSREHAINPDSIRPWYYRIVKGIVFLALPISVGGSLMAYPIITALYGVEFSPASAAFIILIWTIPFNIFHAFGGNIATSIKAEKKAANIFILMAVMNLVLNLILIPRFGILGAAFATVLTDGFATIQFYVLFRREFGAGLQGVKLLRLGAATSIMGVFVFMFHESNIFLVIAAGGILYLALVWVSGAFSVEEREQFLALATRFIPKRST